jgi:hypothetical protein
MCSSPHASHRRLMFAVLQDALTIILSRGQHLRRVRRRLLRETIAWVRSDDLAWPFSFLNVCEALDLDACRLRHRLDPLLDLPSPGWRPAGRRG